jgi:hypothetical protein
MHATTAKLPNLICIDILFSSSLRTGRKPVSQPILSQLRSNNGESWAASGKPTLTPIKSGPDSAHPPNAFTAPISTTPNTAITSPVSIGFA